MSEVIDLALARHRRAIERAGGMPPDHSAIIASDYRAPEA
jgi:hypothetical protein